MFESLFRFLFKYPPLFFEQGDFVLGVSRPMLLAVVAAGLVGGYALLTYRGVLRARGRDRVVLVALRLVTLAVIAFCLMRPALILKAAVPQQNFLGVLLDDSRSLQIADRDGRPRSAFVADALGVDRPLLNALSKKFVLRFFRFSSTADRVQAPAELKYEGSTTRLGGALDRARDELAGLPLAGLVMVSDGADTSDAAIDESIASLKARQIPVFTVGVGQERFARDVQVTRVETPRTALKGTSLVVNVVLTQTGYAGAKVPLNVEDEGRIVGTQEVTLPPDGESATVPISFTASDAGARAYRFKVPVQANEQVVQNNTREALIEVRDRREKILYFEGEPRFETKFIRRAVEDDKNLQVVILQRTAENKYLRLDVGDRDELVDGFPKTRDELFAYRAIILGSVEAASFSPDQLRMIADFVGKRGGGLLMLGGRRSFAEGGWTGTPVGEVLPVNLATTPNPPNAMPSELAVRPTRAGASSPVTQIAGDEVASGKRWNELPTVTTVNPVHGAKPGATVLLTALDNKKQDQVVLAAQRYGRGKAIALPIQDSWQWRMTPKLPVTDTTYATFWRRLARWLVDDVPDRVMLTMTQDRVDPGQPMKLTAEVLDPQYNGINDARVIATVTAPSGKTTDVPLEWTVEHDGEYRSSVVPEEEGLYTVRLAAARESKDLGTATAYVRSTSADNEYFDAAMRAPLLRRIAEETGGRFYTNDVSTLPEAISYSGRGVTVVEERDLWDMPAILLMLIAMIGAEWAYRRGRGLI
ncbi:MAG: glutamine amidotransferase [Acidobacteriota bacterium]